MVKMKRKRYGIQKLSKEETMRLRIRKEERLEISRAKSNLWRHYRRGEEDLEIDEEESSAWKNLEEGILILEEEGEWIMKEEDVKTRLEMRQPKLQIVTETEIQPEDSSQEVSKSVSQVRKSGKPGGQRIHHHHQQKSGRAKKDLPYLSSGEEMRTGGRGTGRERRSAGWWAVWPGEEWWSLQN